MPITTPNYIYPSSVELSEIDQDFLPVLAQSNPIFREFPIKNVDAALVTWEQRDNYVGLMQARGLEGEYPVIPTPKIGRHVMPPGRYGEHAIIHGREIEERRGFATFNQPINVKDLVIERHEQTATRQFNFMSYIAWSIITQGSYQIVGPNGAIIRRDAVTLQSYAPPTYLWSDFANSRPLFDFRQVKLLHRGHSVMFGNTATAWMNTSTFNNMIANTNQQDLGGRRGQGLETVEGIDQYNSVIAMRDNLPKVVEYDEGYLDNAGVFQPFIPDGVTVVIGKRTNGAALGDFAMTRNADNGNSSSPLIKVVEKGLRENEAPPASIAVYRGFNGGPRIYYPTSIVVMKVA